VTVIALLVAAFFFYRYRKIRRGRALENANFIEQSSEKGGHVVELPVVEEYRNQPVELPGKKKRVSAVELPGHHFEQQRT
jgi:N-methylhydantoinase A/oxoprolinase/acetone carboxylase beta subunit